MSSMPRWSRLVAVTLVLVIVAASFGLSFTVLRDLAIAVGIPAEVGWLWPVVVDGTITAATLVLYVDRKKWLPLTTLVVFGLASVVGNVAHILMAQPDGASWGMPVFVGLIPPLGLLMAVELLSGLLKVEARASEAAQEADKSAAVEAPATAATPMATAVEPVIATDAVPVAGTVDIVDLTGSEPGEGDLREEALQEAVTVVDAADDRISDTAEAAAAQEPEAGTQETAQAPASAGQPAPVRELHAVERTPETPDEQVDWILRKARAGVDVSSWKDLARMFEEQLGLDLSSRTIQRRLAEAKKQDPEAFRLAS